MKSKKLIYGALFLLFILIGALLTIFKDKPDYELEYTVDEYKVTEKYVNDQKYYMFEITYEDEVFFFVDSKIVTGKKELVEEISLYKTDEFTCLKIFGDRLSSIAPSCIEDREPIAYSLVQQNDEFYSLTKPQIANEKYENIDIRTLANKKFAIWSTKGYYYLNNKANSHVSLFEKNIYLNTLAEQVGKYVITMDYTSEYNIDKFFILNLENGKIRELNIDNEISKNSYFLGIHDGKAYLFDRKFKTEYEIDPDKRKIEVVGDTKECKVWNLGWEKISTTKLANEDYAFTYSEIYDYEIENKTLVLYYPNTQVGTKVSNREISKIVKVENDTVYYLSGNTLYTYNSSIGEQELLSYNEWEFNQNNAIFIY